MADRHTSDGKQATIGAWKQPTRLPSAWHSLKVLAHIVIRSASNLLDGPRRLECRQQMGAAEIVAEHRSPLWADGREEEFILRCGKVQNLRVAIRCFDGIELKAGQTLSFWSQVGRPTARRGYAVGREIINGCVVPTIGGGLCQLSNALASVAVAVGAHLPERHQHSAAIEGPAPSAAEDATVAWNYVDLRITAPFDLCIETRMTADELVVRLRAANPSTGSAQSAGHAPAARVERPVARGCMTCDQTGCFRYESRPLAASARTAFLLNEYSAEFSPWLEQRARNADWMVPWLRASRRPHSWRTPAERTTVATWPGWQRVARQRLHGGEGASRQAGRVKTAQQLARHYADRLRPEHTELVVAQDLIVHLWRLGILAGRRFDVLMPELPSSELQARLDAAAGAEPAAPSLRDFRIDARWQQDEWTALAAARNRVTAHAAVHAVLQGAGLSATLLPWTEPPTIPVARRAVGAQLTLTFAASALARKGAREVTHVARELGARVLILGSPPTDTALWSGIDWTAPGYASTWLEQSDIVVLPAHIEHQPRALLQALRAGVPVVASTACGLGPRPGLIEIESGSAEALTGAIRAVLANAPGAGNDNAICCSQPGSTP